jgi:hypothetical protein
MGTPGVFRTVSLTLLMATSAEAQQVASQDLLRLPTVVAAPSQKEEKPEYPNGCEKMGVGFVDGVTMAKDRIPRQIKVDLVSISDTNLIVGSEIIATMKLQNAGSNPIRIPWSTDSQTTLDGQDPDNRTWEFGQFQVALRHKKNQYDVLMNNSQPLYGSMFVPGSMLTIKPREWITARISVRVAVEHPAYEKITEGPADLAVEWFQTVRSRVVKNCAVTLGYFPYDSFYDHENRVVVRKVKIRPPAETQKSSQ